MSRTEDTSIRNALAGRELVAVDMLRIETLGCTDTKWSDSSSCLLNGQDWKGETLFTSWDKDFTATVDGEQKTFKANGELESWPEPEEVLGTEVQQIDLILRSSDTNWLDIIQRYEVLNKSVDIWRQMLSPTTLQPIGQPFKFFSGVIIKGSIVKNLNGSGSGVKLEVADSFSEYDQVNGIVCNVESHQNSSSDYAGDTGFEFCTEEERKLPWMDD